MDKHSKNLDEFFKTLPKPSPAPKRKTEKSPVFAMPYGK